MNRITSRPWKYTAGTIGGTNAARTLDKILLELQDKKLVNHVAYYIAHTHDTMKQFRYIPNPEFRFLAVRLFLNKIRADIQEETTIPPDVKSHLTTHLTSICRDAKRESVGLPKGRGSVAESKLGAYKRQAAAPAAS